MMARSCFTLSDWCSCARLWQRREYVKSLCDSWVGKCSRPECRSVSPNVEFCSWSCVAEKSTTKTNKLLELSRTTIKYLIDEKNVLECEGADRSASRSWSQGWQCRSVPTTWASPCASFRTTWRRLSRPWLWRYEIRSCRETSTMVRQALSPSTSSKLARHT